jgi:SAM-dependent methyltransferase
MQTITPKELSEIIGVPLSALKRKASVFPFPDLGYRVLAGRERDRIVLEVLKTIEGGKLRAAGKNDPSRWVRGWGRIRDLVRQQGVSAEVLSPQRHKLLPACRLGGNYVVSDDPLFEFKLSVIVRKAILGHFLKAYPRIVEFGCGTGLNLYILARLYPDKELVGCDWARPSLDMLGEIAASLNRPIGAHEFNMLDLTGADALPLDRETAVVTALALEQLGGEHQPFLTYLLRKKPAFCLNIEPLLELYDPADLADYMAIKYHTRRNYLRGFLPALRRLAEKGTVEIAVERRVKFGNMYHDPYSTVAWRPL